MDPSVWYQDQVVLLTGGTGTLGGCLLYKLAKHLPTRKIFVLCRRSPHKAIEKLEGSMPEQINDVLDTGKVSFIVGDLRKPNLALRSKDLQKLRSEVTIAIHAAANTSLGQDLIGSARDNCLPVLALVEVLRGFEHLRVMLHLSTAYVNSFLPDGPVEEVIHPVHHKQETTPHEELQTLLSSGESITTAQFPVSYAQAKHLTERLLCFEQCPFRVLIVRPSTFSPAVRDPFPMYGLEMVMPTHNYVLMLLRSTEYNAHKLFDLLPPENVHDEIPVDFVANTCLLHLALGTEGIVHAAAHLYQPLTFGDMVSRTLRYAPPGLSELALSTQSKESDALAAHFFGVFTRFSRNWEFSCHRSAGLRKIEGPLNLSLHDHDPEKFFEHRVQQVSRLYYRLLAAETPRGER